jgi:putative ABC transport system ATP-binding protein
MTEEPDHQNQLELRNLTRTISANGNSRTIIDNISYTFDCGDIYTIVGPSGAGKSSLLRLLNRLDEPTGGEVFFEGQDYRSVPTRTIRRRIGYLFQAPYLFPESIADNIKYAAPDITDDRLSFFLVQVGLDKHRRDESVENLSGGEKQRVALARLLAVEPSVLLLDEPTSSLDPTATREIEELVLKIAAQRCFTVIMVTHEPRQALRLSGQTLLLVKGRLIESGTTEKVINNPSSDEGRRYRDRELS